MISNDEVAKALISYLKSQILVTNLLTLLETGAVEIRESQWQGTDFSYPAVRLKMIRNAPTNDDCNKNEIMFSWGVFTEDQSSLYCNQICGTIAEVSHQKHFSSEGLLLSLRVTNLVPAIRSDTRTWRGEVLVSGLVS